MFNSKGLLALAAFTMLTVPALAGSPDVTTGIGETQDQTTTGTTGFTGTQNDTARAIERELNFTDLDMDQDGTVTQNEFSSAADIDDPDTVFDNIDEDGDGQLTQSELQSYRTTNPGSSVQEDEGGGWFQ